MQSDIRIRGARNDASPSEAESSHRRHISRQANENLPKASDFWVRSLPGVEDMTTHPTHPLNLYAGLLPSYPGEDRGGGDGDTGKDAEIFFMLAKARRAAGKQRVIFWFNGGPGCSSFDGSLMEVGPFRTVPASQTESGKVELKLVEGGWEEYANVVFVDQPPGTGLSFVPTNGYLHELDQASQHLIQFMRNFYSVFPELLGLDTYLAGESFAGQYIPYFANALLQSPPSGIFTLTGIAIGNGWIDPMSQYPGYIDFAYEKGLLTKGTPAANHADELLEQCMGELDKFRGVESIPINLGGGCESLMGAVTEPFTQELNGKKMCMNVYDVRLMDEWPACGMNWPPDLPDVYDFLRRDDVVRQLHAEKRSSAWTECDGQVSSQLYLRTSGASVQYIPSILDAGVKVMMFAGAEDLICNYKGIENMLDNMRWSGTQGLGNATAAEWYFNGTQVGTWTESRGMTYVKVLKSSHMVGFDVPQVTNDMITRFMGVDLSLVPGDLGKTSGRIGSSQKVALSIGAAAGGMPLLKGGGSDLETWYNAGSAFVILLFLVGIVVAYLYFKRNSRLRRKVGLPITRDDEAERIPLGTERVELDEIDRAREYELDDDGRKYKRGGKGKGKARERFRDEEESNGKNAFALGDDEDDAR